MTRNDYDERHTTYARPGHYEREQEGTRISYRYYLGDYAFLDRINDGGVLSEVIHYRHADPQNSLIATSGANPGSDTQAFAYEAWGIPLYDDWNGWHRDWDDPLPTSQRGYTGQEHLQQSGLLHLNGRVYDPYTARFLSPDPELQDPSDTQSYNRYSYVLNNPFKYVDPTGFDPEPIRLPKIRVEVGPLGMDDYLAKGASSVTRDYFEFTPTQQRWQEALGEPAPAYGQAVAGGAATVAQYGVVVAEEAPWLAMSISSPVAFRIALERLAARLGLGAVAKGGLWSSTKNKSAVENALGHWNKHKSEFPELQNAKQYAEKAKAFLTNPSKGTLTKTNSRGDTLRYDPSTNTFGVLSKDGAPRTMFRPKDGMDYWNRQ